MTMGASGVVVDTMPTGHPIRFLQVPELAQAWFNTAPRLVLKHRGAVKLGAVGWLVNLVTPPTDCPFCGAKRREEQRYTQQVMARHPDHRIAQAPMLPEEIKGIDELIEFGRALYRNEPMLCRA